VTALAPPEFLGALRERGFDVLSGVPCSIFKALLAYLDNQDDVPYLPAAREDQAMGFAAGAAMGGQRPVVLMQNSGLGVSINAIISLHQIYRIQTLLLITWRGYEGVDAPEHIIMGPAMPSILDTLEVPHRTLEPDCDAAGCLAALDWADTTLRETGKPVALLVRKGAL
jgi:sulfopyruvate decarboxylase subunit alpha